SEIEAGPPTVAIHAREKDLARAEPGDATRPLARVESSRRAAAVRVALPAPGGGLARVDGRDDALGPVAPRGFGDQRRILHGRGIDAHLIGAGVEQRADVVDPRYATTNGERDEHLVRNRFDHAVEEAPGLDACLDVEERE